MMSRMTCRWIAVGLIAYLAPLLTFASLCAAMCADEGSRVIVETVQAPSHHSEQADASSGLPFAASAVCLFAATPALTGTSRPFAMSATAEGSPIDSGARSLPAEPAPPLEPPDNFTRRCDAVRAVGPHAKS